MSWSITVAVKPKTTSRARLLANGVAVRPTGKRRVFEVSQARWREIPVYERAQLAAGAIIKGPALITEDQTTIVMTADFDATVNSLGYLVLDQHRKN